MLSDILRKKIKLNSNTEVQGSSRKTPQPDSVGSTPAKTAGN